MFMLEESETYKMIIKKEKSIKIAKKLLKEGMDIDKVADITELNKDEVKKLIQH